MSIQLRIERRERWIVARLRGAGKMEELTRHYAPIAAECLRANLTRLLVDFTKVQVPLSTRDRYELGSRAVIFARHGIKVAAVARPAQIDQAKFGELVAKTRRVNVRLFAEMREAEAWLLAEK